MEVPLTAEKESRLRELAARLGRDTSAVVEEAIDRMLDYELRFTEAVETGRQTARRGELIEHDAVVERIERILRA